MTAHGLMRVAEKLFVTGGLLLLAIGGFQWGRLAVFQTYPEWFARIEPQPLDGQLPRSISGVTIAARLEIPRLKTSVVVFEGDDDRTLELGAGHVPGTARLGAAGNAVIAGHRDTVFRSLRKLKTGDLLKLRTKEATLRYRVTNLQIVDPSRVQVLRASDRPMLTLLTCYPFRFVGDAPERYVVQADLIR